MEKNGIFINCDICESEIYVSNSRIGIRKYCNNYCKYKMMSKRMKGKPSNNAIGGWNKGIKMKPMSREAIEKRTMGLKKNKVEKGYKTNENHRARNNDEYKDWRKIIYERDDYTCQLCQKRGRIDLNAHHIKYFHKCLELRFDKNNGATLCIDCHEDIHHLLGWNQ